MEMIRAPPREGEMGLANVPFPQFIVIHTVKGFDIVNIAEKLMGAGPEKLQNRI